MFTFNKNLMLIKVCANFINTHKLQSIKALQNTSIITLLAFIVSPETQADHDVLRETEVRLKALRISDAITYKFLIANQLYEVAFKAISNDEIIGTLKRLESPQILSNTNKKLGGLLTPYKQSGAPAIAGSINKDMSPKFNSSIITNPSVSPIKTNNGSLPRIIVVDDSEVNKDVVDIFLTPDFPMPIHAKNGLEALDILQHKQVDVILMDIHMPEMNGIEAALAIRKMNKPWSNIIIIALTADTVYHHSHVYKNIGMDDAISKPLRQEVLIKTVLRNWNAFQLRKEAQTAKLDYAS